MARSTCRPVLILIAGALISGSLAACAGGGSSSAGSAPMGSMFTGRPRVSVSVAESHPGSGVDQLDFFDTLEKRDLVSHDDALHASLLLLTGQSGQTFVQRAGRAKQMGILPAKFDRPPREAVTVGELSMILAAGMRRPSAGSASHAVDDLKGLGILPEFAQENAGVSGAQLLTILGHSEDAMASMPLTRSYEPPPPAPEPVPEASSATFEPEPEPAPPPAPPPAPLAPRERKIISPAVFSERPAALAARQPEKKPVRKPPIDLEESARVPREGQILPDPNLGAEPAPAPVEPAPVPSDVAPAPSGLRRLPPPRADGGVPSRVDAVGSNLRYVAVDRLEVEATDVLGPGEFVQFRSVDDGRGDPGEWQTFHPGQPINDRIEIRTGLGARVTLRADDATIVLHRLSRVRLERKVRSDGKSQVGVTLYRGLIEVTPAESADARPEDKIPVYIRTPDQVFPLRTRALFEYDAFRGTVAQEFRRLSIFPSR